MRQALRAKSAMEKGPWETNELHKGSNPIATFMSRSLEPEARSIVVRQIQPFSRVGNWSPDVVPTVCPGTGRQDRQGHDADEHSVASLRPPSCPSLPMVATRVSQQGGPHGGERGDSLGEDDVSQMEEER